MKVCQVEQSTSVINVTASSPVDTEEQVEVPELRKALRREEAKNAWKNKSGALTRKMNTMNKLMSDQANVEEVQEDLQKCIEILESSSSIELSYQMSVLKTYSSGMSQKG